MSEGYEVPLSYRGDRLSSALYYNTFNSVSNAGWVFSKVTGKILCIFLVFVSREGKVGKYASLDRHVEKCQSTRSREGFSFFFFSSVCCSSFLFREPKTVLEFDSMGLTQDDIFTGRMWN